MRKIAGSFLIISLLVSGLMAQKDEGKYVPRSKSPVLEEIRKSMEAENAAKDSITQAIRSRQKADAEKKRENRQVFQADFSNVKKPEGLKDFKSYFHFDPVAQYYSGMCWCFTTTSFLESEVKRITGQEIKLSELHTVYYQYVAKARRFIRERGKSLFAEGSESNAVLEMMDAHGAVPAEVYTGLKKYDKHNHLQMFDDMMDYLNYCKEKDYWEERVIISTIKNIMNQYLGAPPESFEWQGKIYTPLEFKNNVLKINSDDYVEFMSTLSIPFYTQGIFDVPDNWWLDSSYYNIPLDEWYDLILKSIKKGYTVNIGGDVSEPGYVGEEDVAFIPDFIMPQKYINQYSREYGITSGTTSDDHGIHIVGYTKKAGHDWFLIKDSGRGARKGKEELRGYYMWRDDYVKMKMLSFMIHKDVAKNILEQFN